ncbi:MAG: cache domain-containing protein [Desulfobacteraceae bacterium]|nr:cache domain-containing protein [Desulfobacteraceae bacterium]
MPIWAVFLVFVLSIFFVFIPSLKTNLTDQKKEMIQTLTDSAVSLLHEYHQRVVSGELPQSEAKSRAMEQIRHMRYGADAKDYFWIIDMHPFMVMHPFRPDLEGQDLTGFADLRGNYPFLAMVEKVLGHGSGYVDYYWQWKDASHKIVPKLSYVKEFKPWGWIVGTGIYLADVQAEISATLNNLHKIMAAILIFVLALSAYITWQTIRIRNKKIRVENTLQKERETLSTILESIPHGISLVDNEGRCLYVNSSFTKITGYTLDDIPTKKVWFQKAYPDKAYRKKVMQAWGKDISSQEGSHVREFQITCRNKETKYIEFRSCFLEDKKISVLTDVTDRKETEEISREKDRLQAVLELSGAVCHEMNQPLMSISGYFDIILMEMSEDDPHYPRIKKIQAQLERMAGITKKMMQISKYQTKAYLNGKILDIAGTSETGNGSGTAAKPDNGSSMQKKQ